MCKTRPYLSASILIVCSLSSPHHICQLRGAQGRSIWVVSTAPSHYWSYWHINNQYIQSTPLRMSQFNLEALALEPVQAYVNATLRLIKFLSFVKALLLSLALFTPLSQRWHEWSLSTCSREAHFQELTSGSCVWSVEMFYSREWKQSNNHSWYL